jgi:hypothetical protein
VVIVEFRLMVEVLLYHHGHHRAACVGRFSGCVSLLPVRSPRTCRCGGFLAGVVDGEAEDAYLQVVAVGEWLTTPRPGCLG